MTKDVLFSAFLLPYPVITPSSLSQYGNIFPGLSMTGTALTRREGGTAYCGGEYSKVLLDLHNSVRVKIARSIILLENNI